MWFGDVYIPPEFVGSLSAVVAYLALSIPKMRSKPEIDHARIAELEHEFGMEHMDEEVKEACAVCSPEARMLQSIFHLPYLGSVMTPNEAREISTHPDILTEEYK